MQFFNVTSFIFLKIEFDTGPSIGICQLLGNTVFGMINLFGLVDLIFSWCFV